jgi:hypothetical protein
MASGIDHESGELGGLSIDSQEKRDLTPAGELIAAWLLSGG